MSFINNECHEYKDMLEKRINNWMCESNEDEIWLKSIGMGNKDIAVEEFRNRYFLNGKASLFHFNLNNITIWLLNCSNEYFYNYCSEGNIKLDAIMLYRHNDDFFYQKEAMIIKELEIKEGIGSPSYIQFNKEKQIETNIIWDSMYNADKTDIVSLIQYY